MAQNLIKGVGLSFARPVTLAKSVIQALPTYTMTRNMVAKYCVKKIYRIQRDLIWGHDEYTKNMHTVCWSDICKPKKIGGLGIQNLSKMNEACIRKM